MLIYRHWHWIRYEYKKELPLIIVTANSDKGECLDLTSKIKPDGTLDWTAPQGDWTICALFQGHHGKW